MRNGYLRDDVKFEPLSWSWYSWVQLVNPVTSSLNLMNRYFNILESFIETPELHLEASNNPNLIGGPFVNLGVESVDTVVDLLNRTRTENKSLIDLYNNLRKLDSLIMCSNGDTMESLYVEIPETLKGTVELVYNENNNATVRYIEPLIYNKFYDTSSQSVIFSNIDRDKRDFILSTPRIPMEREVEIKMPFCSSVLDSIFKSRSESHDIDEIVKQLDLSESCRTVFKSFFTDKKDLKSRKEVDPQKINIKYFGHACVLIQYNSISILIDPIISYNYHTENARYTYSDLPEKIDYVLITHAHQDHISFETLLQLRHKIKNIVVPRNNTGFILDPSLKLILIKLGFKNIIELGELENIELPFGEIVTIPFLGEHGDFNIQSKLAYLVRINNKKILFAVDSNNLENVLYEHIERIFGKIDILFLGMECEGAPQSWIYGPLLFKSLDSSFDNKRRLSGSNYTKTWSILKTLKCKEIYIYAMGQESWLSHIMGLGYSSNSPQIIESDMLLKKCKESGVFAERLLNKREWEFI